MNAKLLTVAFLTIGSSLAHAAPAQAVSASSYIAYFTTTMPNRPRVRVFSPLGAQLGYSYHFLYSSSVYAQFNGLSSGKSLFLQGLNLGFEYSFLGGHDRSVSLPQNTTISATSDHRVSLFSAITFMHLNLKDFVSSSTKILGPTIPTQGKAVGLDFGVGYEKPLLNHLKWTSRASVLIPEFIDQEEQQGMVISFATGLNTVF